MSVGAKHWTIIALGLAVISAAAFLLISPLVSAVPCPGGGTHCPGDLTGDGSIDACDITQTELCILYPETYPKGNYPGWDSNGDGQGPNSGDIRGVGYRCLDMWPHNRVHMEAPGELGHCTNFTAYVRVTYVEDFDSASYDVFYDASVLDVTRVTAGKINFITVPASHSFPQGAGMVRIQNDVPGSSGVSGAGYLSKIRFHVNGSVCDATGIIFDQPQCWLKDSNGVEMNSSWVNDSFHVFGPYVPEPSPTASLTASPTPTLTPTPSATPTTTMTPCGYIYINSTEGGSVTEPGEGFYQPPCMHPTPVAVDLLAVADPGYDFDVWTGDVGEIDDIYAAETVIQWYMGNTTFITANFMLLPTPTMSPTASPTPSPSGLP